LIEEFGLPGYHLDSDSLFPAIRDVHDFELAALDTLQHGLARDTELAGCLVHGHEAVPSRLAESGDEVPSFNPALNEVALTPAIRSMPRHATSQNPPDSSSMPCLIPAVTAGLRASVFC
jgi:hypothetical protein